MVENENPPTSWFYDVWHTARIVHWVKWTIAVPAMEWFDASLIRRRPMTEPAQVRDDKPSMGTYILMVIGAGLLVYGVYRIGGVMLKFPLAAWESILLGIGATMLRVFVALILAMLWTIPVGYAIGSNPRLAGWLQPVVQVVASLPATALFPVLVASLVMVYQGLNLAAILLMLLGTQWYMLFNIIGGASAIPQDLNYTSALLGLGRWERWRTLILPALFPFIITGAITASGGAWNASIVAEYITYNGQTLHVTGIGAVIAGATANGDYVLLFAATLSMILTVVMINRLLWRRLYKVAETKYKME
jgi:NitT/TauT family transport system permease protein